jgi:hypothetical protein
MPGFGPLESTDEVRRMIADLVDRIGQAAKPSSPEAGTEPAQITENSGDSDPPAAPAATEVLAPVGNHAPNSEAAPDLKEQVLVRSNKEDVAAQHDLPESRADFNQLSRRSHGGALPR